MRRFISAAVLTSAALALTACGGSTTPTPSATTLEFSAAPASLKIGSSSTLTVVAKDAQGNVVPGTATLTGSDDRLVSVGSDGKATALRLTPDGLPVTVMAKFGSLEKTMQLGTYGLELVGGTYNFNPGTSQAALGTVLTTRFRAAPGAAAFTNVPVTVTGPAGFDANLFKLAVSKPTTEGLADTFAYTVRDQKPVPGIYSATTTVNGEVYTASATLDPASVLKPVSGPTVTLTKTTFNLSAAPLPGTTVSGVVYTTTDNIVFSRDRDASQLPVNFTLPTPLAAGVYYRGVYTYGSPIRTFGSPTPQQLDVAWTYLGATTIQ